MHAQELGSRACVTEVEPCGFDMQSLKDYEQDAGDLAFLQAVVKGIVDLEEGREVSLKDS